VFSIIFPIRIKWCLAFGNEFLTADGYEYESKVQNFMLGAVFSIFWKAYEKLVAQNAVNALKSYAPL
jgi:hypothetical protein